MRLEGKRGKGERKRVNEEKKRKVKQVYRGRKIMVNKGGKINEREGDKDGK